MKDILLTGGAGFIGSTLADKLLKEGHQVTVIDNFSDFYNPEEKENNILPLLKFPNFKLIRLDITDYDGLFAKIDKHDVIIHLAAKAGVRPSIEDPLGYEEVNVKGTINLLEFAKHHKIKQFVLHHQAVYMELILKYHGLKIHKLIILLVRMREQRDLPKYRENL